MHMWRSETAPCEAQERPQVVRLWRQKPFPAGQRCPPHIALELVGERWIRCLKHRYYGLTGLRGMGTIWLFKAQFHFINFIISSYCILVLGRKPRALSTLKDAPTLSATQPPFPRWFQGQPLTPFLAWDFPEAISSLECPELLSFFGKHWSPVLNFVY